VILEVPQSLGLDVLAVYADGSVRYINQTGHMTFLETPDEELEKRVREVLKAAQPLAERYPAQKRRDDPVPAGRLRLTFLTRKGNRVAEAADRRKAGELEPVYLAGAMVLQYIVERRPPGR
jgi:hypothetical protein